MVGNNLEQAQHLLEQGELVAIPTETVYGLAGNALNAAAVARIFEVKNRPEFDPLIVHVASWQHALHYVQNPPPLAEALAKKFWPGPLTLLLPKQDHIPHLVTAGLDTVGVRCPDHALTQALLQRLKFPLAAPSANPFKYVSPTRAAHVNDQLGDRIPYILDGGPCAVGIESTIVGFDGHTAVVYRMGGISVEEIEAVAGTVQTRLHSTSNPKAPGQLLSHYAPRKKVVLGDIPHLLHDFEGRRIGLLCWQHDYNLPRQQVLSPSGSLAEAAQHLFEALRALDKMPIDIILAEPVPDTGLGRAINDRLRRAAAS